jgi:hypothetical protein
MALVLKKIVRSYSIVNHHKIIPVDALAISVNLLPLANNIFMYLKTHQHKEIIAKVDAIERIFE